MLDWTTMVDRWPTVSRRGQHAHALVRRHQVAEDGVGGSRHRARAHLQRRPTTATVCQTTVAVNCQLVYILDKLLVVHFTCICVVWCFCGDLFVDFHLCFNRAALTSLTDPCMAPPK